MKVKIPVKNKGLRNAIPIFRFRLLQMLFSLWNQRILRMKIAQCDIESELDSSFVIDEATQLSDTDTDEDDDEDVSINEHDSPILESKFIVFWSCLTSLFKICSTCNQGASIEKAVTRGTLLILTIVCINNHTNKWYSQPRIGSMAMGNLLIASSLLYSGNTFTRIKEMMDMINLRVFGFTVYTRIQKTILFPPLIRFTSDTAIS